MRFRAVGVKQIPWTFKTWLANFKGVDLPIGDLADNFLEDPNFPDSDDYYALRRFILEKKYDEAVLDAFRVSWKFYKLSS